MSEINKTWDFAQESFAWADYSALLSAGVSKYHLASYARQKLLGAEDIKINGKNWVRQFKGERAIIIPVYAPITYGLMDLIAFRPDTPRSFWVFEGTAPFLGYESVARAEFMGEPLVIHESPLDWLLAGCEGCVILDWRHFWPAYFANIPAIRVNNLNFGQRLTAHLERPFNIPDVQVAI